MCYVHLNTRLTSLLVFLLLTTPAQAQQAWELVWADEFEYEGLPDPTAWTHEVGGGGWGNQELQYYTEGRLKNARVEDGHLVIEAHREEYGGNAYTSARLVTRGHADWLYGRIEARAQLPGGRGVWPAIWMLPTANSYGGWPSSGEIDVMEYVGFDPGVVHGTVHTEAFNHMIGTQKGDATSVPDAEEAFHVYAVEWTPERIDFFVDSTRYFTFENRNTGWEAWPFDRAFYLILNVAVGGAWGGQQGVDPDVWPQQMVVDYVRVYQNDATPRVTLHDVPRDRLEPGATLAVAAEATGPDIERVHLYQGAARMATDETAPYEFAVENVWAGCYEMTAEAQGADGWAVRSAPDTVRVGEACGQAPYLMAPAVLPGTLEAEYFDLGGEGVGYHDADTLNEGGAARTDGGVDIERTSDEQVNYNVGWISPDEWLAYTVLVEEAGFFTLEARVAAENATGAFRLAVDGEAVSETISFTPTGGWQAWRTVSADSIRLEAGVHTLRVDMLASEFNLDRLTFTRATGTAAESPARGALRLSGAPNPSAGPTTVELTLPAPGDVQVAVYDVQGRRVALLLDAHRAAGTYRLPFDGTGLAAGTYFVRLVTSTAQRVLPMTLLR